MRSSLRKLRRNALITAAITGVVWLSGVRLFAFPGKSMEPSVMAGDTFVGLVGLWGLRAPARFDRIIFDVPATSRWAERKIPWMKRVVGLPGEKIRLSGDRLFVNGRELVSSFLHRDPAAQPSRDFELTLKAEEYCVLGDNLDHSFDDSRTLGPIAKSLLRGRVAFVIHRRTGKPRAPTSRERGRPRAKFPSAPISDSASSRRLHGKTLKRPVFPFSFAIRRRQITLTRPSPLFACQKSPTSPISGLSPGTLRRRANGRSNGRSKRSPPPASMVSPPNSRPNIAGSRKLTACATSSASSPRTIRRNLRA